MTKENGQRMNSRNTTPKAVRIAFCTAASKINATTEQVDTGTNNFHCPITGSWVELTTVDGVVVCSETGCDNNDRPSSNNKGLAWLV